MSTAMERRGIPSVIPGLWGTAMFELSVIVYDRHRDAGGGSCVACGHRVPCPARRSAAAVVFAAGDAPHSDEVSGTARLLSPSNHQSEQIPAEVGFAVTGRNRILPSAGFSYERDTS